jgi:hypothetical protein
LGFSDWSDNSFPVTLVAWSKLEGSTIELLVQNVQQMANRTALPVGVPDRDKRVFFSPLQKVDDGAA